MSTIPYFIAYAFNKAYLNNKEPGRKFDVLEVEERICLLVG